MAQASFFNLTKAAWEKLVKGQLLRRFRDSKLTRESTSVKPEQLFKAMILEKGNPMINIRLKEFADGGRLLGTRQIALPIRDQVERALEGGETVALDFGDTNPTQSFVDELVGSLILERGIKVLDGLVMQNCSDDVKAILHFVVSDRIDQIEERGAVSTN